LAREQRNPLLYRFENCADGNFFGRGCLTAPSRPEDKDRQIRFSTGSNVWQAEVSGAFSLQVPLKAGLNHLDIVRRDPPMVLAHANGDPLALPLGLWDYRISNKEEVTN
jgi:hypothetical protein